MKKHFMKINVVELEEADLKESSSPLHNVFMQVYETKTNKGAAMFIPMLKSTPKTGPTARLDESLSEYLRQLLNTEGVKLDDLGRDITIYFVRDADDSILYMGGLMQQPNILRVSNEN